MTAASTKATPKAAHLPEDPEHYRMSIGDHLEELRGRLVLALIGFVIIAAVCLFFGNTVVAYFCRPLLVTLKSRNLPTQLYSTQLGDSFMVYMQISLISAAAFSAPWALYQLWLFVAAGLYPNERKYITRYMPLSIALLISGMVFVYFLVLPWTIQFFIDWTITVKPPEFSENRVVDPPANIMKVPFLDGDPPIKSLHDGDMYFNRLSGKLIMILAGQRRYVPFGPESLVVPQIRLDEYIDLVVMMLIMFGIAFQLPLVVMAILKIGIVEASQLRAARKVVYFVLLIIAAGITPGDVITATIALMFPLILLYELGIFLGERGAPKEA